MKRLLLSGVEVKWQASGSFIDIGVAFWFHGM